MLASAPVLLCSEAACDAHIAIALKSVEAVRDFSRTSNDQATLTCCRLLCAVLSTIKTHIKQREKKEQRAEKYEF